LKREYLFAVSLLLFAFASVLFAQDELIGDISDGSRAKSVHLIKLIDQDSSTVRLDDQPLMPFSTRNTCGACHNYQKISKGWHFNAGDSGIAAGRPGQPWIYFDQQSSTQIPLSFRSWPGTYKPQQLGMSTLQFLQTFGRQMPGGGAGENETLRSRDNLFRWMISGDLEVNCLSCHDAEFAHNQAEYPAQTARENFRWAAAATSAFAWVRGSAKDMPVKYDLYAGRAPDETTEMAPQIFYDESRFNYKNEVYFDITKNVPDENCYYCHSSKIITNESKISSLNSSDVHLASGLHCVTCHQNGLDHNIVRGYEGEPADNKSKYSEVLTCQGCHLGEETAAAPDNGFAGAPRPEHKGIPTVHFEKLTCTACHSGAWPASQGAYVKTSMAHALGVHGANKSDVALPHIISTVMIRQADGKIAPHNLLWPSFWAEIKGDSLYPMAIEKIKPVTQALLANYDTLYTGNWLNLTPDSILKVLDSLQVLPDSNRTYAFVSGGFLYKIGQDSILIKEENPAAAPYVWPIAHDVRPAQQSLGIRGCNDCHATDAPFYYSSVNIESPLNYSTKAGMSMIDFQDSNRLGTWIFSFSFFFRPWLKLIIILSAIIIAGVLLLYAFKGLSVITNTLDSEK
jgi:hypothetical protein